MKYVNKIEQKFRIKMLKQVYYVQLLVFFFLSAFSPPHQPPNSPKEPNNKEWGLGRDRAGQGLTCTYSKQRFVIGWENNRDGDITMALSLKTIGSAGYRDQWNKRFEWVQVNRGTVLFLIHFGSHFPCGKRFYREIKTRVMYGCNEWMLLCWTKFKNSELLNFYG